MAALRQFCSANSLLFSEAFFFAFCIEYWIEYLFIRDVVVVVMIEVVVMIIMIVMMVI